MTPEEKVRQDIDRQLEQCGWLLQDYQEMNISAGLGRAVREFRLAMGKAEYLLHVDAKAIGVRLRPAALCHRHDQRFDRVTP